MSKKRICMQCRKPIDGEFCERGCEYQDARNADRLKCEKETGCTFGEPFFVLKGIQLIATGYEGPYVQLKLKMQDEKGLHLGKTELRVLRSAIDQAIKWCEKGWAPGSC